MFPIFKNFLLAFVAMLAIFLTSIVAVSAIPSSLLENNIGKSVATLSAEGQYPTFGLVGRQIALDNFTDSLMLNTAYSVDSSDPLKAALVNTRHEGATDSINQVANLEKLYLKGDIVEVGYERYWHGYLVYLRPMLTVMPYSGVRMAITIALYLSVFIFVGTMWKKLGAGPAVTALIGLIAVDTGYLGQSMQFSSVMIIGLVGATYLITSFTCCESECKNDEVSLALPFFIIGGITSFMDLLTAPLVTLGLMLATVAYLHKQPSIKALFSYCVSWSVGYLLIWGSKWVLVELLYTPGAIATAIDQIANRTTDKADANFSHLKALQLNFFQLIGYHKTSKIIVAGIALTMGAIFLRYMRIKKDTLPKIAPWLFIMVIPYIWYVIAANHSYLHVWFTYRNQLMSVIAGVSIYLACINTEKLTKDLHVFSPRKSTRNRS